MDSYEHHGVCRRSLSQSSFYHCCMAKFSFSVCFGRRCASELFDFRFFICCRISAFACRGQTDSIKKKDRSYRQKAEWIKMDIAYNTVSYVLPCFTC